MRMLAMVSALGVTVWGAAHVPAPVALDGVLLPTAGDSVPIAGAQIWVPGTRWGALTDSVGRFYLELGVVGTVVLAIRVCEGKVTWNQVPVPWPEGVPVRLYATVPVDCRPPGRPAWVVDSSDTTTYRGTLYRGNGGFPFVTCKGQVLYADLPPKIVDQLEGQYTGDSLVIILRGRLDSDVASRMHVAFLVSEARSVDSTENRSCE